MLKVMFFVEKKEFVIFKKKNDICNNIKFLYIKVKFLWWCYEFRWIVLKEVDGILCELNGKEIVNINVKRKVFV